MEIKQAVQSSANVIRITSVSAGDVYKRFNNDDSDCIYYGIVKAVHNDGESVKIEAVEYCYRWSSLTIEYKVLSGKNNYCLFPATPDDLNLELEKAKRNAQKEIEEAENKIDKNKKLIIEMEGLISGETQKSLKAMSYKEMTQTEYEERKQLI